MVIKSGFVFRKKGIVTNNKRRLILTNQPRLYYTTENGDYKGDIVLTQFVQASVIQPNQFEIFCKKSGKKIIFKLNIDEAGTWVSKINRVIDS